MSEPSCAVLRVDLGALRRNYRAMAAMAGSTKAAGVVKANGYGLGTAEVGRALAQEDCDTFFVAHPSEGATLRQALPNARIFVLNGLFSGAPPYYAANALTPVLGSRAEIDEWAAFCRAEGLSGDAALHVDTGMNRLGLDMAEAASLAEPGVGAGGLAELGFRPVLLMSHLACADDLSHPLTAKQIRRFDALRPLYAGVPASLANSAGIARAEKPHYDLVRPGIALYGGTFIAGQAPLEAVVTLTAPVIQTRDISPGDGVGYGLTWVAERPSRIAIISVGYADGFLRAGSSPNGAATVNGVPCPLAGRISMDLIAIDVTAAGRVERGTPVDLLNATRTVNDAAHAAGTISYEILTSLGRRYRRVYEGG